MLREVKVLGDLGDDCEALASRSYRVWVPKLLHHLSFSAPALRSLEVTPLSKSNNQIESVLPLIGALSQLESLVLREWRYSSADIAAIHHLTRLQNLKVSLSDCRDHGNTNEVSQSPNCLKFFWCCIAKIMR